MREQLARRSAFLKLLGIAGDAESFAVAATWRNHSFDMIAHTFDIKDTKVSNNTQNLRPLTEYPYLKDNISAYELLN